MLYMYLSDLSKYILSASLWLWPGAPDLGGWKLVMATLKICIGICLYNFIHSCVAFKVMCIYNLWCISIVYMNTYIYIYICIYTIYIIYNNRTVFFLEVLRLLKPKPHHDRYDHLGRAMPGLSGSPVCPFVSPSIHQREPKPWEDDQRHGTFRTGYPTGETLPSKEGFPKDVPLFSQGKKSNLELAKFGRRMKNPFFFANSSNQKPIVCMIPVHLQRKCARDCKGQEESVRAAGPHSVLLHFCHSLQRCLLSIVPLPADFVMCSDFHLSSYLYIFLLWREAICKHPSATTFSLLQSFSSIRTASSVWKNPFYYNEMSYQPVTPPDVEQVMATPLKSGTGGARWIKPFGWYLLGRWELREFRDEWQLSKTTFFLVYFFGGIFLGGGYYFEGVFCWGIFWECFFLGVLCCEGRKDT